ncbi:MAG TPA: hypothetical protein VK932_21720 [Kofleriaceae bacterium]|nr:hypothetical protein [Kofleriaceae bacterium]
MRITSLAAAMALFVPPATTLTSAGCACSLIDLHQGLRVDLAIPEAPDTYRIEVDAEGEVLSLSLQVTGPSETLCLDGGCQVVGERVMLVDGFPSEGHRLAVRISSLEEEGGPETATVRVFRGGALAAEDTFEPRYETDYPNGRGCGKHVHASASLVVP